MNGFWTRNAAFAAVGMAGAILGISALSLTGCSGGSSSASGAGPVVATVNGEKISTDDWHKYLETKNKVNVIANNNQIAEAQVAETLGYQGFQDMLRNKLILQLAADEGVAPNDKDILDEIEFRKKRSANFMQELTAAGFSLADIKDDLRVNLAREKILTKGITVSDLEVDRYIETHPKDFIEPPQVNMLWIFVKKPETKALVDADITQGQGFAPVAARYSDAEGAKDGARFPQNNAAALPGPIKKIAETLTEAKTSEWLTLSDGFAKFYMEKKTAAKKVKIDDVLKVFVRRQLAMQRGIQAIDLDTRLLEKMKASKIEVKNELLKTRWDKALESLKDMEEKKNAASATPKK
ncbi:MAG: SurA N-terminal domain-containing protein [Armatimonadetes bacterium]|nr:SurA N-terminal domain-containing protein [Armatimonadota bacterium]